MKLAPHKNHPEIIGIQDRLTRITGIAAPATGTDPLAAIKLHAKNLHGVIANLVDDTETDTAEVDRAIKELSEFIDRNDLKLVAKVTGFERIKAELQADLKAMKKKYPDSKAWKTIGKISAYVSLATSLAVGAMYRPGIPGEDVDRGMNKSHISYLLDNSFNKNDTRDGFDKFWDALQGDERLGERAYALAMGKENTIKLDAKNPKDTLTITTKIFGNERRIRISAKNGTTGDESSHIFKRIDGGPIMICEGDETNGFVEADAATLNTVLEGYAAW